MFVANMHYVDIESCVPVEMSSMHKVMNEEKMMIKYSFSNRSCWHGSH